MKKIEGLKLLTPLVAPMMAPVMSACLPDYSDHSACTPEGEVPRGPTLQVVLSPEDLPRPFAYETLPDGTLVIEADMAVGLARDLTPILPDSIVTTGGLWKPDDIPYRVSPELPSPKRVATAIRNWEERSAGRIRFRELHHTDPLPEDYIEFFAGDGCWSHVGRIGGKQLISLSSDCSSRTATHELGHALGLLHEQSRSDRDEYVSVKWCNIVDGEADNFRKREHSSRDIGPYDYASIMHYPSWAFSKNGKNTLQSVTATPVTLWTTGKISDGDWNAIAEIYGLDGDESGNTPAAD